MRISDYELDENGDVVFDDEGNAVPASGGNRLLWLLFWPIRIVGILLFCIVHLCLSLYVMIRYRTHEDRKAAYEYYDAWSMFGGKQ